MDDWHVRELGRVSDCDSTVRLLFASLILFPLVAGAVSWPLKINAGNRYLEDQSGTPFFIMGEAPWSRIIANTTNEWKEYLTNRLNKGWNTVLVQIEAADAYLPSPPANVNGVNPFNPAESITNPQAAYYAHIDTQIQSAKDMGFLVIAVPLYSGYFDGDGWQDEAVTAGTNNCYAHGVYLGGRYHATNFGNIMWMIGHDMRLANTTSAKTNVYNYLKLGLLAADSTTLYSAGGHEDYGPIGSDSQYGDAEFGNFIDVDNLYNWKTNFAAAGHTAWGQGKPFWGMEGKYENEDATQLRLRAQSYQSVLSGGCGTTTYGEESIWNGSVAWSTAETHLDDEGAVDQGYVGNLFRSRRWWNMVPDTTGTFRTSAASSLINYRAARFSTETGIVYIPEGSGAGAVSIDMGEITGTTANCYWFNPRDGTSSFIGAYDSSGSRNFTASDGNDWVLVIDNAAASGLDVPGGDPVVETSVARSATVSGTFRAY